MTAWADRVQNHAVHQTLRGLEGALEGADPKLTQAEPTVFEYDRLRQVAAFARRALDGVDPNLCPAGLLDALNSGLSQMQSSFATFVANPAQPSYLQQASSYADSVVQQALALPFVRDEGDVGAIRDAVTRLRQSLSQYVRTVGEDVAGLRGLTTEGTSKAEALRAEIERQTGRLDTALSTFQQQFSSAQDGRSTEFTAAEKARAAEGAEAERRRAAEHAEAMKERATAADELIATAHAATQAALAVDRQAFQGALADAQAARERAEGALAERSREHLETLAEHRRRAEELVGVIGQTGMVSGFQRVANEERATARVWLGLATVALVGLVACAVWIVLLPSLPGGFRWEAAASRVFLSLAFGALAGFAARQAGQHQEVERRNRRMELELASVGPFLQQLPEETRHEMIRQLADRMFAQPTAAPAPPAGDSIKPPSPEIIGVAKTALELVAGSKK